MKKSCSRRIATLAFAVSLSQTTAFTTPSSSRNSLTQLNVVGEQASSIGPAQVLRNLKETLPQISWLAEGEAPAEEAEAAEGSDTETPSEE